MACSSQSDRPLHARHFLVRSLAAPAQPALFLSATRMANASSRRALRSAALLAAGVLALVSSVVGAPVTPASTTTMPAVAGLDDWKSVANVTVCPAQVRYDEKLRVLVAWCADGVEGFEFEARNQKYVCKTLRLNLPVGSGDRDVAGGCVARLHRVSRSDAVPFGNDV